jgi:YD repeat-containing protein
VASSVWGSQWRGNYDRSIAYASNGTISTATVKRQGGKQLYFNLSGSTFVGDADVTGALIRLGVDATGNATGWTYRNESDELETYDATGKLLSITNKAGLTQTLTYSDGTDGITSGNGGYVLDAAGLATTAILPAGKLIRITDPEGRSLQFGYDAAGRVVKLTDPAGGTTLYGYIGPLLTDNLTSVTRPDGTTRTYLYGEAANVSATPDAGVSYAHALTGIIDENGTRYASWTYDAAGRATSSEHGPYGSGIDKVTLAYTAPDANGNSTTAVTDVMGTTRTYNFSTILGVVKNTGITGLPCNGCNAALSYDANGNVASRTDFNGNKTCYAYDLTRNLETVRIEGLPSTTACPVDLATYVPATAAGSVERKTTTIWDATYRLPVQVAEPLRLTRYSYDPQGNLLNKTVQPTTDTTGGAGLAAVAAGTARTISYTHSPLGQVLTIDGARTDVADITTYNYYAIDASCTGASALGCRGQLQSVSNALNQTTQLSDYDANGRAGRLTDPNGLVTTLSYDLRGRLTSRNTGNETTAYSYDGVGNLTQVSLPAGGSYSYTYDAAHRLTDITDSQGNRIHYTLDNAGNRTKEETFDSTGTIIQTHSRQFDALNRLWKDIGAVNQTTVYEYDANGNLTRITDPLNRQSSNSYDALNRLISSTQTDGGIVQYGYDGQDQLTQVTDPRNLTTQYQRDGLGNLDQQTSPDTGATGYTYDAAGNVLTRTDAKGQVATYSYDALNRLTGIVYTGGAASQSVSYQYDQGTNGIGHLTKIVDGTGSTDYTYDVHGRLTSQTRQPATSTTPYVTVYGYDAQGRLSSITYPSGRAVNYTFDGMGRISQIATTYEGVTRILTSNIVYEPFGGVHSFTYGDGSTTPVQTYTRQRDQDGRIASYSLNGKLQSIGYDAASQISFIADSQNLANTANYGYDAMSRLNNYTQGALNQSYGYDTDGNRTSQIIGSTATNYGYAPDSNRLTGIQTGPTTQSLTHDANGATTSDATRQYSYDLRGRLIQATTAQGIVNYEVNALGLRVRKQVPYANTDTTYHYDLQGHLIGESPTNTNQFTREYIYLGDQPVAVMQ